jgi:hypothetical protein
MNGSFELGGQFTAEDWSYTCDVPGMGTGGAPGGGNWHATVAPGNFKGCFPSYLYQPLPNAQNGELYRFTGWVRCHSEEPCIGGFIGLGRINGTTIEVDDQAGGQYPDWTFVQIVDTIELDEGEVAAAVLSAGSIGGPAILNPAHFDGLQLDLAMGMGTEVVPPLHYIVDHTQRMIFLSTRGEGITAIRLLDMTGRELSTRPFAGTSTAQVDLNGLPPGAYLAQVRTARVERTFRFVID